MYITLDLTCSCCWCLVSDFVHELLQVSNKKAIVECLMVYDALHKRSAYLDAFAQGLEKLGVKTLMSMFPEECKKAFVWDGTVKAHEVVSMMSPVPSICDMLPGQRVWEYLIRFIENAKEGMKPMYTNL